MMLDLSKVKGVDRMAMSYFEMELSVDAAAEVLMDVQGVREGIVGLF